MATAMRMTSAASASAVNAGLGRGIVRRRVGGGGVRVRAAATAGSGSGSEIENCPGCLGPESCPCPKAVRRAKQKAQRQRTEQAATEAEGQGRRAMLASLVATAAASTVGGAVEPAEAMSNGAVSDAWAAISGAPSDLTFPDEFLGTWLCYSTLTAVATPQGEDLVQDMAVVKRARGDVGNQIIYPMRFVRNDQGRVVMDRAYNVVKMAEATARAYNVIENVEWDVDDPNVLRGSIGDGRSVFFRVNQRSEEIPAPDRIETSEVAQIVFDGGDNGGYSLTPAAAAADGIPDVSFAPPGAVGPAKQPKIKSSRTFTKWKWRSAEASEASGGPAIVASQNVYDYLTSFDQGFIESKGQPVTQYTYKLALFKANKYNLEN
jgi:hypothetical protein